MGLADSEWVVAAAHLFDGAPVAAHLAKFLSEPNHHLLIAYVGDHPAGFVSGVEISHPDKATEMLLYELAVDESHRRQGIGKALVNELSHLARRLGCRGVWVLADHDNPAALATYRSLTGAGEERPVLFSWEFHLGSR